MDATNTNSIEQSLELNKILKKHNISLSVFLFVACVENEQLSLGDIGLKIETSSAGMTSIRDCAIEMNFAREVNSDDRRKKIYTITDKGIELLAGIRQ